MTTQLEGPESVRTGQPTFADMYERELTGPLFRPFAEAALDAADLSPHGSLLDVACGTGCVARLARERWGPRTRVVGVDINIDMIAVARVAAPTIDWREGSALALPRSRNERFEVIVCQQGLQFFPDRSAALAQMRQALAPGGCLVISTWRPDTEMPLLRALRGIAERHLGAIEDRRHGLGNADDLETLVREAGLVDVRVATVVRRVCFPNALPFLRLNTAALVAMSDAGQAMDLEARTHVVEQIVRESAPVLWHHASLDGFSFDIAANQVTASGRHDDRGVSCCTLISRPRVSCSGR